MGIIFQVKLSCIYTWVLSETASVASNSSVGDEVSPFPVPGTRTFSDVAAMDDWETDSIDFPEKIFPGKKNRKKKKKKAPKSASRLYNVHLLYD